MPCISRITSHYNDVKWARWRLKSPVSSLFAQLLVQARIRENIKAPCHWLCAGNSPVIGEFPAQKASNAENVSIWWRHHEQFYNCVAVHVYGLLHSYRITHDDVIKLQWPIDQSQRYGRHQAACREPAGSYDKTTRTAICFEHKTRYLLIRAPYTRIVVFWHISNITPMILQSQISCNTPRLDIAAIFMRYCYTTGSWLL